MSLQKSPIIHLGILAAAVLLVATAASAAGPGRELTKARCKVCHLEGSSGGTMTPLSKTQRQWERFFDKGQHESIAPGTWKNISSKELEQIRLYLIKHAADSPQPETCG